MRRFVVSFTVTILSVALVLPARVLRPATPPVRTAPAKLHRAPLAFEPNVGQADASVKFLAHTGGTTLTLTPTEAALSLPGATSIARPAGRLTERAPSDVLGLAFIGSNPSAAVVGTDRLPGVSNYFIGNDPSAWRTGVAQFGRVTYRGLYPGIDLTFYGNQSGRLEYDFTLRPGADPSFIRLGFEGADALRFDSSGNLVIGLAETSLVQPKPRIYQVVEGTRTPISGGYMLDGNELRFAIGTFDATKPLVIDPEVGYSTYLGGSGDDLGEEQLAVDSSGQVYVCGDTDSPDFPITAGAYQTELVGGFDAFVTKLTPDGSGVVYSTYLGGTTDPLGGEGVALGVACTVDGSGNLYVVGATNAIDFPTTDGAFQRELRGGYCCLADGFAAKLSPDGSALLYSTYLGGSGDDFGLSVALDQAGDAVAALDTNSPDFPTTPGAFQTAYAGGHGPGCKPACGDEVILKLNSTGSDLIYSTYLGGPGNDGLVNLALDPAGDVFVDGLTYEQHFPTTPGAFQPHFGGGATDAYVAKLDPTGSSLIYGTYLGGGGDDFATNIAIDAAGDVYVGGNTCSRNFPVTPGAFQTSNAGGTTVCWVIRGPGDGFITKLNPQGTGLVFSTYLGGSGPDGVAVAGVEPSGDVIFVGGTDSTDFPVTPDAFQPTNHGGGDEIIGELRADGSSLIFATYWGGSAIDAINGGAFDSSGNLYITGCTESTDFPVTPGAFQTTFQGGNALPFFVCNGPTDAFVTKFAFGG
jgi:hypothetical protein